MAEPSPKYLPTDWYDQPVQPSGWSDLLVDDSIEQGLGYGLILTLVLIPILCIDAGVYLAGLPWSILTLLLTGLFVHYRSKSRRLFAQRLRNMMDLPVMEFQFPARVQYRERRFVYGRDYGIVSLVDGMVHFHGQRSHFSFPQATVPGFEWIQPTEGFNEDNEVRLTSRVTLTGNEQRVDISFLRTLSTGLVKSRHRLDFSEALLVRFTNWKHSERVEGAVYRLPPRGPNRDALLFSKWEAIPVLGLAIVGIPLTFALSIIAGFRKNGSYALHLMAPVCIAVVAAAYFFFWWQRRRRLLRMLEAQVIRDRAHRAATEPVRAEETGVLSLRG